IKVKFSTDDYDGSFIESLSQRDLDNTEARNALKTRIMECEGILFFIPCETGKDEQALSDFEHEVNTITRLVEEIMGDKYVSLPMPICLCVTKWDLSPHFKQKNEKQHAKDYIESIPTYQRIYAKLNTLFNEVEIFPVSAFGLTEDGRHPIKGKITPHNVEPPIDYCLDKLFPRYEQRISDFQQSGDEADLFDYLHELYEDLIHYKNGKYCRLYDDLEQKLADQILRDIQAKKQEKLSGQQESIYDCLRRNELRTALDHAILKNISTRHRKKRIGALVLVLIALVAAVGGFYLTTERKAQNQFAQFNNTKKNGNISLTELIPQAIKINSEWEKPMGLPLEGWFKNDLHHILETTGASVRTKLMHLIEIVKNESSPDMETIQQIKELMEAMVSWPDKDLLGTLQAMYKPLDDSLKLRKNLREDSVRVDTLELSRYRDLKDRVADSVFKWPEMDERLLSIKQTLEQRIKTDAYSAIESGNLDRLEKSADDLQQLLQEYGDIEAGKILEEELSPVLTKARLQQRLRKMLGTINGTGDIARMKDAVKNNWMEEFSQQDKDEIKNVLQKKFIEYEKKNLPKDKTITTIHDLDRIRDNINTVQNATKDPITAGFENRELFRYQRPEQIKGYISSLENKLSKYKYAIDNGVEVYVTFKKDKTGTNRSDDLHFNCSPRNRDISIAFEGDGPELLNDDKERYPCEETSTSTGLKWKNKILLTNGKHKIYVTEHDLTKLSSEKWSSPEFDFESKEIIELLNNHSVTLEIYPYKLTLSTK
ncbi:hypothetical protein ACFL0B_08265, partial [Thermodesulfobacteriota bacterium]